MAHEQSPHPDHESRVSELRGEAAWWRGLAIALLVVGAVVAWLLVREVRSHNSDNARIDVLQKQIEAMGSVLRGTRVEDLTLLGAQGSRNSTVFDAAPLTLVVLLSNHCTACETAAPAWAQVVARLSSEGVPSWMIVTDPGNVVEDSSRWAGLAPYSVPDADRTWLRGVPGVPSAVLVDQHRVVRATWLRPIGPSDVDGVVQVVREELLKPD